MDISKTLEPRSDQQNYDDYLSGSKIVTVSEVKIVATEQPVELHLVEFPGRPYKPGKSMRRVLAYCWGTDSAAYVGRRLELYGDPSITFGKDRVGGIRIAALSHLEKPVEISLTVTRGKRAPFTVQPLPDESGRDWLAELALAGDDADSVKALGIAAKSAGAKAPVLATIRARYQELAS